MFFQEGNPPELNLITGQIQKNLHPITPLDGVQIFIDSHRSRQILRSDVTANGGDFFRESLQSARKSQV